jgi:hypothetical protein
VGMSESLVWVDVASPGSLSFSFLSNRSYFQIAILEDINFMVSLSGLVQERLWCLRTIARADVRPRLARSRHPAHDRYPRPVAAGRCAWDGGRAAQV